MKLLYLWVQEYGIFHNRNFCFSAEYSFSFDLQKNVLNCRRNQECPFAVYNTGNVGLISYIVGDNGQGKTTLLRLLMEILPYEGRSYSRTPGYILVLKDDMDNALYAYTTLPYIQIRPQNEIQIKNCKDLTLHMMMPDIRRRYICDQMRETSLIFHSNVFDRDRYSTRSIFRGVEDISFNGLLQSDFENQKGRSEQDERIQPECYLAADTLRQIRFVATDIGETYQHFIPFFLPDRLYLIFREEDEMLDPVYTYDQKKLPKPAADKIYQYKSIVSFYTWRSDSYSLPLLQEMVAHICRDVLKRYNKRFQDQENRFYTLLHKGILMSCIRMVFSKTSGTEDTKKFTSLISRLRQFMSNRHPDDSMTFVVQFVQTVCEENYDRLKQSMAELTRLEDQLHHIKKQFEQYYIPTASNEEFLIALYQIFSDTSFGYDYLIFRWSGLSSGEYNLLSMYSRIYSLCDKLQEYKALIFLIDEADLSYHPKWQQSYVKHLVRFLNSFFPKHQIQIILATHSPIMLSDALKGNVVFLGQSQDETLKNTFGANIYDLYREGMFLERGHFGIIGSYAAGKLEDVMQALELWERNPDQIPENCWSLKEIENFIACVGEPAIKRILRAKWEMVEKKVHHGDKAVPEKEISSLIADLRKLPPNQLKQILKEIRQDETTDDLKG